MATNGEGPAKRGKKDSLLEELEQAHAEVLSRQQSTDKKVIPQQSPQVPAAEAGTPESKQAESKLVTDFKAFIAAAETEKTKARMQEETVEELRNIAAARAAATAPSGVDVDAPTLKISVPAEAPVPVISSEAQKLEAEEQAEIDKRIAAERAAEAEEGARLIKGMFGATQKPQQGVTAEAQPSSTRKPKTRVRHFEPHVEVMRNYDEEGRSAVQSNSPVQSWGPKIKKGPELDKKPSKRKSHTPPFVVEVPGFEQVETKSGLAWTESEIAVSPQPRERRASAPINIEPLIQVETKKPTDEQSGAMESVTVPFEGVKRILSEQLGEKAQINRLDVSDTPEGLQIQAELRHGAAGKINIQGTLVSEGGTIGVSELQVTADRFVGRARAAVEEGLAGIDAAIKTELERQHGKPISTLQVGPAGLMVEFAPAPDVTESSGRIEPTLGAEPHEEIPAPEGTPKEWREKLRALIEGATEKTKEKVEWWKNAGEHLVRRNTELDAQAEKLGGVERIFRTWGEKYNKLPFKYKVAVGASLGVGAALSAGTLVMALPLLGIAAQRVTGLATMYLKFEKNSHQEKWGKEKAMLKAGVYTVLLGLAMKEAIEYASQTEIAHAAQAKVEGWLGNMLGHKPVPSELPKVVTMPEQASAVAQTPRVEAPVTSEQPAAAIGHQASADVQAAAMSPRPEGMPASATAPESTPLISVAAEASQPATAPEAVPVAQEAKPLAAAAPEVKEPAAAAPEVEKLEADEGIVVTEIQIPVPEPTEPFVAPIETVDTLHAPAEVSAAAPVIEPEAPVAAVADELPKETVTSWPPIPKEGLIDLTEAQDAHQQELDAVRADGIVEAAPVIEPEAPVAAVADELPKETVTSWPPIPKEGLIDLTEAQDAHQQELDAAATIEEPRSSVETPVLEAQPLPVETIVTPDTTVERVDRTNAPEFVSQPHVETPSVSVPEEQPLPVEAIVSPDTTVTPVDRADAPEFVSQPHVETPPEAPLEAPVSTPAPAEQTVNIMPNKFGLTIPSNETHLYAGANGKDVFVFGGTAQEKARVMLEFFKENPTKIIYTADETGMKRIPWRFIQGQLVPDKPAQEGWLFARTLLGAPSPDDLAKVIK